MFLLYFYVGYRFGQWAPLKPTVYKTYIDIHFICINLLTFIFSKQLHYIKILNTQLLDYC